MRRALTHLAFFDLIFILILSLSSLFGAIVGEIVYYLAFAVPVLLAFVLRKNAGVEIKPPRLSMSAKNIVLTIPMIPITLALIFLVSWITSLILSLIGDGSVSDVSGNIVTVILKHALLTALLEEMLFRYIPIAYLSNVSKRGAVLYSAIFFALAHCNLYQLPYAFVAGIIFAALDIAFDSVLPSLLLHFVNNIMSVFWIRGSSNSRFVLIYVSVLFAFALISLVPIVIMRRKYRESLSPVFLDKTKLQVPIEAVLFMVMTLVIAVTNL